LLIFLLYIYIYLFKQHFHSLIYCNIIKKKKKKKKKAEHHFDEKLTSFSSDIGPINLLTFHEFEPWVSVANDKDIIR